MQLSKRLDLFGAEVFAALVNAVVLLVVCGFLAWTAVGRLFAPTEVHGQGVVAFALLGLLANLVSLAVLARADRTSLNIRGAFLHMAADAAVSAGVVAAGLAILATGWLWLDPAVSLVTTGAGGFSS